MKTRFICSASRTTSGMPGARSRMTVMSRCAEEYSWAALSMTGRQRLRHGIGRRHAREVGELVDELLEPVRFLNDGPAAFIEDAVEVRRALGVLLPKPLGRQLDRRERVLELVGDPAARHPARSRPSSPGSAPSGRQR